MFKIEVKNYFQFSASHFPHSHMPKDTHTRTQFSCRRDEEREGTERGGLFDVFHTQVNPWPPWLQRLLPQLKGTSARLLLPSQSGIDSERLGKRMPARGHLPVQLMVRLRARLLARALARVWV